MAREGGRGVGNRAPCETPGDETSPTSAISAGFESLLSSHYLQRHRLLLHFLTGSQMEQNALSFPLRFESEPLYINSCKRRGALPLQKLSPLPQLRVAVTVMAPYERHEMCPKQTPRAAIACAQEHTGRHAGYTCKHSDS